MSQASRTICGSIKAIMLLVSLPVAVILVSLAVIVLVKNPKSHINQSLAVISSGVVLWILTSVVSDLPTSDPLFWNRAVFVGPIVTIVAFYFFTKFLSGKSVSKNIILLIMGGLVVSIGLIFSPFGIKEVIPRSSINDAFAGYDLVRGAGYTFYVAYLISLIVVALGTMYLTYKNSKNILKVQFQHIFLGTFLACLWGVFFNIILPAITGTSEYSYYGPLSGIILVSFLAYAIVKHRFLDIRLIIARSLAYLFSWSVLTAIYAFALVNVASVVFDTQISISLELFVYILVGLVLITGLLPLKKGFDRVTNRLFYRDAYDSQALIERLNRLLVTNIDIDVLLKKSATLIEDNIKAEFCFFSLKETAYMPRRTVGDIGRKFDAKDLAAIADLGSKTKQRVLVTDELDETHAELRDKLNHYNIAMLARLSTSPKHDQEGTGFLILGHKKSGNPYNSQDVKVIGIIANEMVIAIQNSLRFEEIEKFTITLQEKVDDATKKLRQTNEKLKTIDETKDEFISMASHQLRTPLTSVKGYLSMVLEGDAGELNEMQSRLLNQAFISSQRMVYLIADLLNVSRLRTGKFVIEPKPTNLADVVQGEVEQLIDTAASRGIELKYDKPADFPILELDENKLRQVIMNFTDNAIYYTPSGGHIEVALEDKGDTIEFTVTDDGMGVPKAEQQHLFNKFYRAANARQARPDGTGLGLFMSKKIIIAQGGEVIFNSTENKGSTFGFSFNKAKLAKLAPETLPAEN